MPTHLGDNSPRVVGTLFFSEWGISSLKVMAQIVTTGYTFDDILDVVAKAAEVDASAILSKNRTVEVVDARHVLVQILADQDWQPARIARKLDLTEGTVSRILDHFHNRCKYGGWTINNTLNIARNTIKVNKA